MLPKIRPPKRSIQNQSVHDSVVGILARHLVRDPKYSDVKADHINWPNGAPDDGYGHVPDVSAWTSDFIFKRSRMAIFEVETKDSLASQDTVVQCQAFSRWKRRGLGDFYLVVPKGLALATWTWVRVNQISVTDVWEIGV